MFLGQVNFVSFFGIKKCLNSFVVLTNFSLPSSFSLNAYNDALKVITDSLCHCKQFA